MFSSQLLKIGVLCLCAAAAFGLGAADRFQSHMAVSCFAGGILALVVSAATFLAGKFFKR